MFWTKKLFNMKIENNDISVLREETKLLKFWALNKIVIIGHFCEVPIINWQCCPIYR